MLFLRGKRGNRSSEIGPGYLRSVRMFKSHWINEKYGSEKEKLNFKAKSQVKSIKDINEKKKCI